MKTDVISYENSSKPSVVNVCAAGRRACAKVTGDQKNMMQTHLEAARFFVILRIAACLLALQACSSPAPQHAPPLVIENSIGMKLVRVPAGEFFMGSDESPESLAASFPQYERKRLEELSDESPVHRVRITRDFFLGRHEVTIGQFRRFVEASGYVPESIADGTGGYGYNAAHAASTASRGEAFEGRDPKYSWQHTGFAQDDSHPVLNVTWNDAVAMAAWLSRREGKTYRLPTEAEWEYACRAGSSARYHPAQGAKGETVAVAGHDPQSLLAIANTFDAAALPFWSNWKAYALPSSDGHAFTAPVGSFAANAFGLHDMLGNAWEWTADFHDETYYARSPVADPAGPADGSARVRRGGSWHTWALYARCSYRNWNAASTRYTLVGIRLLREVD
jgi:formylglycine-generating enzyme